jgi:hypothetical protein
MEFALHAAICFCLKEQPDSFIEIRFPSTLLHAPASASATVNEGAVTTAQPLVFSSSTSLSKRKDN